MQDLERVVAGNPSDSRREDTPYPKDDDKPESRASESKASEPEDTEHVRVSKLEQLFDRLTTTVVRQATEAPMR